MILRVEINSYVVEWLLSLMVEHASQAHWVVFGSLILAGLNVPISEDLVAILTGALASQVVPENVLKLALALFLGAYLSDWLAYGIGRLLGPQIWRIRWLARAIRKERFERVSGYYERYGFVTLLVGRFIPFGVRNGLFISAGMARMPFGQFLIADGVAAIGSIALTFCLGYVFAKNYETVVSWFGVADVIIFGLFILAVVTVVCYKYRNRAVVQGE